MKKQNKNLKLKKIIPVAIAILILICAVSVIAVISNQEQTIAFYGMGELEAKGIKTILDEICEKQNLKYKYVTYNSEKKLSSQIPLSNKPKIIFTTSGYAVDEALDAASKKVSLSKDLTKGMTTSMIVAAKSVDEKLKAIPVLSSHFETDIDTSEFRTSSVKSINTWQDVEFFLHDQKRKKDYPMIFAGNDYDFFLDFIGAFAESIDGEAAYKKAAEIIKETSDPLKAVKKLCDEEVSPLKNSVKLLQKWYNLGYIHPSVFSLNQNDVEAFAKNRLASVLFMSLEKHRELPAKTISKYSSIYFPSEISSNLRNFTGNIYYAVPLTKSSDTEKLLNDLVLPENQEKLCRATGLAPVLSHCKTPDSQSSDARMWIAATKAPLPGLSKEYYLKQDQKKTICAEIGARIKQGK